MARAIWFCNWNLLLSHVNGELAQVFVFEIQGVALGVFEA